jgi:hypothetical protein
MRLFRWLSILWKCPHEGLYKERVKGVLTMICADCGQAFPVALSDKKLGKRLAARMRASRFTTAKAEPIRRVK